MRNSKKGLDVRIEPPSPGVLALGQERDQTDETHVAEEQRGHERRAAEQALGHQLPARTEIEQQVQTGAVTSVAMPAELVVRESA